MPLTRRCLLSSIALAAFLGAGSPVLADEPLVVVASFSILGDMVSVVGGERVHVTTLVGPGEDAHVFDPAPADARRLAAADLVVVNGLGFEGWVDRLVEASGYDGTIAVASTGVDALPAGDGNHHHDEDEAHHDDEDHHDEADHEDEDHHEDEDMHVGDHEEGDHHGAFDPHAWQDLANGAFYVDNIAAALSAADPAGADLYAANAEAYLAEMAALDSQIRATMDALPQQARTIVTSHDAFGYFGHAYGIVFLAPEGLSTEDEPSAAEISMLIDQIEEDHISAVFMENISDNRMLERIAQDTGVVIGGTLYSDSLSPSDGPAPTYLAMMRYNASTLASALQAF